MSACRLCVVDTEPSCVTDIIAERDQLRADLAAAVAENAALLAANRDCIWHFDAIKADYDAMKLRAEQAEARLARNTCEYCDGTGDVHTPTGEWRGECDCVYAQNNKMRARLAAIDSAPTVTYLYKFPYMNGFVWRHSQLEFNGARAVDSMELIARPAKD